MRRKLVQPLEVFCLERQQEGVRKEGREGKKEGGREGRMMTDNKRRGEEREEERIGEKRKKNCFKLIYLLLPFKIF